MTKSPASINLKVSSSIKFRMYSKAFSTGKLLIAASAILFILYFELKVSSLLIKIDALASEFDSYKFF